MTWLGLESETIWTYFLQRVALSNSIVMTLVSEICFSHDMVVWNMAMSRLQPGHFFLGSSNCVLKFILSKKCLVITTQQDGFLKNATTYVAFESE